MASSTRAAAAAAAEAEAEEQGTRSFMERMAGQEEGDKGSMLDKDPERMGAPEDVTPARTFFVRMVAQREIEVNEKEWFEVLERHGMNPNSLRLKASSSQPSSSASGGYRSHDYRDPSKPLMRTHRQKGKSPPNWRETTSNFQILKTPLQGEEDKEESYRDEVEYNPVRKAKRRTPLLEVVSPFSIYYAVWQYSMMVLDFTYTAFWVPYSVVFVLEDCQWDHPAAIVDFTAGWLYVFDVLVNLRVGYSIVYKLSRTVELDSMRAALFYIQHGTFWVDVPACIPVFVQTICLSVNGADTSFGKFGVNVSQMMRLLRLLRLARAMRLLLSDALDVASVSVKRSTGAKMIWIQFLQIVFLFAWTAHMMACTWYYTAVMEDSLPNWPYRNGELYSCIEGLEEDAPKTWLKTAGLLCAPNGVKYMASFYFATMTITTVGYGDISADTTGEQAVATVMMFVGAIFFGYLVSTTTLFLEKVSSQKKELTNYHDKVELVDGWVRNRAIPKKLNMKIRSYYSIVWSKAADLQNEKEILQELPFPLRAAAAEHITMPLLKQVLCLSHVAERHWKHMSRRFRAEWYPPGKFIAHSEGRGSGEGLKPEMDSLWLLERGKVVCVKQGANNASLIGPQVFGCSLILQLLDPDFPLETSFNTYMSTTPIWLWRVNKEYLRAYFQDNPDALVQFCEGLLVDVDQLNILDIDNAAENALYTKVLELKETLPLDEEGLLSLPRGASRTNIFTVQEEGQWTSTLSDDPS